MIKKFLKFLGLSVVFAYWILAFYHCYNYSIKWPKNINQRYANNLSVQETIQLSQKILPVLKSLVKRKNFKYFRIDVDK